MNDSDYDAILARQLTMSEDTWVSLQSHGVTEASLLKLDFFYVAPDKKSAEQLSLIFQDETDYETQIVQDGSFFRKSYKVQGSTKDTTISLEILKQWITWMIVTGRKANCSFDGWGAEV